MAVMAVTATQKVEWAIIKELADLRFRQLDEPPEIKLVDSKKTHGRINALLDQLYKPKAI